MFCTSTGECDGKDFPRKQAQLCRCSIVRKLPGEHADTRSSRKKGSTRGSIWVHRREALKPTAIWQVAQLDIKLLRDDGAIGKPVV